MVIDLSSNTRDKIIEAAVQVFAEKGYSGASIEEIAERAGVSKGLVFWYFKSKKNLVREIALNVLPRTLFEKCAEEYSGRELVDCVVDKFLEKYGDPNMRRLLLFTFSYQALDEEIDKEISRLCSSTISFLAEKIYGNNSLENRVKVRSLIGSLICYVLTPHECIPPSKYGGVVKKIFYPSQE